MNIEEECRYINTTIALNWKEDHGAKIGCLMFMVNDLARICLELSRQNEALKRRIETMESLQGEVDRLILCARSSDD